MGILKMSINKEMYFKKTKLNTYCALYVHNKNNSTICQMPVKK